MSSSLVRAGFVRGSMTQGNGCYLHRCINHTLEVLVSAPSFIVLYIHQEDKFADLFSTALSSELSSPLTLYGVC